MKNRLTRLAYTIEFLIALPVVYTVWGQIAGQSHLDLVFWYWKLGMGIAIAWATVRATAAAVEHERAWNFRTIKWVATIMLLGLGCAMVTYYVHLYYEGEEELMEEEEDGAYTATRLALRGGGVVEMQLGQGAAYAHLAPRAGKLD